MMVLERCEWPPTGASSSTLGYESIRRTSGSTTAAAASSTSCYAACVPEFDARIFHHDLCFGCGQANLFGLQLELEPRADGGVERRFFVKQDHQGRPGFAHRGVLAAALDEAMALLLHGQGTFGLDGRLRSSIWPPPRSG